MTSEIGNADADDFSDLPDELRRELLVFDTRSRAVRAEAMLALRRLGWTMPKIGVAFGVSKQRVHQFLGATDISTPPVAGHIADPST
jgi:DNA-directed RNA polymerase sigma subunit (sigma70/sigma32)